MGLKTLLHRTAIRAEAMADRLLPQSGRPPRLEAYRGYATPTHLVLRGRVLTRLRHAVPHAEQSRWTNLKQMVSLFLTDEVRGVPVAVEDREGAATSDEEGYVTIRVPRAASDGPGWARLSAHLPGEDAAPVPVPVLVPPEDADWGVISDVDDTMIRTGAHSLTRNLWTTFTGSALSRHVFPDSLALIERLVEGGKNPVFYVSSSPWNLHHFLDALFSRAGLTPGPMFLRDLGIGEDQFISGTHGDHKGAAIDTILEANPGLGFVLVGDTGQHDAEVYRDAIFRHPGRIRAVILRQPGPGPDAESHAAMEAIRATGTALFTDRDFAELSDDVMAALPQGG